MSCVRKVCAVSSISRMWEFCCSQLLELVVPLILAMLGGTWALFQFSDDSGCWQSSCVCNCCLSAFVTLLSNLVTAFPLGELSSYDWVLRVPYSFGTGPLSLICRHCTCFLSIFGLPLHFLSIVFKRQWILNSLALNFDEIQSIFYLMVHIRNSLPTSMSYQLKRMPFAFTYMSMIHFKFISMCDLG